MKILSYSPEQTITIGHKLGEILKPGNVICLEGDLGAGKTHFAKGVALGLGVDEHVTSPTYTIINEYNGRMPFFHVDAYRLEDEDEAYELGLEEYLYGAGVTLLEWPERVAPLLPEEYLTVAIKPVDMGEDYRELVFLAKGQSYNKLIEELSTDVHTGD